MAAVAAVGLLLLVALPTLGDAKLGSERATCMNNLGQVGRAFRAWATDHGGSNPWWVLYRGGAPGQPLPGSGTHGHPGENNSWFQFSWISNELRTPRILACPSDAKVVPADDFTGGPGGFLHSTRRNQSTSYILGLHSTYDSPESVLSGDDNLRGAQAGRGCAAVSSGAWAFSIQPVPDPAIGWTNAVHGTVGNILQTDGRVSLTGSLELQRLLRNSNPRVSGGHEEHFLIPSR